MRWSVLIGLTAMILCGGGGAGSGWRGAGCRSPRRGRRRRGRRRRSGEGGERVGWRTRRRRPRLVATRRGALSRFDAQKALSFGSRLNEGDLGRPTIVIA